MNAQYSLPSFGPDPRDSFRFTKWNTPEGVWVWVNVRGDWRRGVIVARGRKNVSIRLESRNGKAWRVRKPYSELRRSR